MQYLFYPKGLQKLKKNLIEIEFLLNKIFVTVEFFGSNLVLPLILIKLFFVFISINLCKLKTNLLSTKTKGLL